MVSLHSTYSDGRDGHGHHHYKYKRRKHKHPVIPDLDLLTRTSYTDAEIGSIQIKKGKASGNEAALWLRAPIQYELFKLGCRLQRHAGKVLFLGILILAILSVGMKSATLETRVEKLWVQEGGRLQEELKYVESKLGRGAGSTSELIIQTPRDDGSILTPEALLAHLDVVKAASKVVVEKHDVTWKLKDLCYAQTIPTTEISVIDQILDKLFPCAIITPMDCFWEGSKLLGPDLVHIPFKDEGSMPYNWETLNPMNLVQKMKTMYGNIKGNKGNNFEFKAFEDFMKRAGINSGYQEKPCLNPYDPDCPSTAPNKESGQKPDIGAELTGGCYGFAPRYMHWPEQLVVGGTTKNKTGHITRAKGLQSSIQLMGEKDLFDYWSDTFKVHSLEWNQEVAASILSQWQAKFTEEVLVLIEEKQFHRKYEINAFSSFYLNDILAQFSEVNWIKVTIGYVIMMLYTGLVLYCWSNSVKSQAGLGLSGVFLVIITVAGGLGASALIGIPFNPSTTQILPFIALGTGVNAMFIMTQTYSELLQSAILPEEDIVGEVLKRSGVSVVLITLVHTAAFLAAAIIPIPAMRAFMFQAALVTAFNALSMILLFPAALGLDKRRVSAQKMDILCCRKNSENRNSCNALSANSNIASSKVKKFPEPSTEQQQHKKASILSKWTLKAFVNQRYSLWVLQPAFKIVTFTLWFFLTSYGVYSWIHLEPGLNMQEVVPRNTTEYNFIKSQNAYFGFYNMYAVTQGHFEYPQNQKILYDYHNAFIRVPNIIKDDNGGFDDFWLPLFRNWLIKLQDAFDDDFSKGNIYEYGWHQNCSSDGILAYKLMVQTGHVDYPVDETLLLRKRLVDAHGMIDPDGFYNYLSAWYSNDAMAVSHSQAEFRPEPKTWHHAPEDYDLKIPKSMPIQYAQIPFYLYNLDRDTSTMVDMITQVREVCAKFEDRGLPNFPRGNPFTYWEAYRHLNGWFLTALGCIMVTVGLMTSILMMSPWVGGIVMIVIASIVVQLHGVMGFLDINLSAVPVVVTVFAVGLGVEFSLHVIIGFVTSIGNKNRRIMLSLQHMFAPVVHSAVSTFLGIIALAFSHFDFVVKYFFLVFTGLIVLGIFNGLIFLPVLLVLVGPPAEVIPNDNADAISPTTPELTSAHHCNNKKLGGRPGGAASNHHHHHNHPPAATTAGTHQTSHSNRYATHPPNKSGKYNNCDNNFQSMKKHHQSDLSLSTIAEESGSYASNCAPVGGGGGCHDAYPMTSQSLNGANVVIEPHVVVETTTYPSTHGNASGNSSRCSTPTAQQVTKVTATAKFKVEVHTPATGATTTNSSEPPTRPVSASGSRRSSRRNSSNQHGSAPSSGNSSVHSSLSDSLRSSLSSYDGDAGFSDNK